MRNTINPDCTKRHNSIREMTNIASAICLLGPLRTEKRLAGKARDCAIDSKCNVMHKDNHKNANFNHTK